MLGTSVWPSNHDSLHSPLLPSETSQRPGEHSDEVHATLHPMHQTQRNQEAQRLGGRTVSDSLIHD